MGPRDVVQHFVEAMTQLMSVLRHEIDLINTRDFNSLETLQRRKMQLSKSYESSQSQLRKDLSVLDALSSEERTELRKLYAAFREAVSDNMLCLKSAYDASDRVVKMIISGVKKSRGANGAKPTAPGKPIRGYAAYAAASAGTIGLSRTL